MATVKQLEKMNKDLRQQIRELRDQVKEGTEKSDSCCRHKQPGVQDKNRPEAYSRPKLARLPGRTSVREPRNLCGSLLFTRPSC